MTKNDKENYLISIIGEQKIDGQTDKIEVLTSGNYLVKKDHFYIGYKEYDDDNPNIVFNNLIKVEQNKVTINRKGPLGSQLLLEKNRRHQCIYQTIAGDLTIGVFTKTLNSTLGADGGTLEVSYTLDFNTDLMSENSFKIEVKQKQITE